MVPNENIAIALSFSIHLCKLTHLHIHQFSLKYIFGELSETKQI